MRPLGPPTGRTLIVLGSLVLHLALGARGLFREDVDLFAMKPFSDRIARCAVRLEEGNKELPFPKATYVRVPAPSFTARPYLETMQAHAEGLRDSLRDDYPHVSVEILCTPLP